MSQLSVTLPKQPALKPAEDYYRLRREGIGFIEQMGSQLWTDYNTHDPGITILEALCYALTDLAYRTGWDIKDILASATPAADPGQPFPNQPFFTAREILTANPWTPDDFRRLLIDLDAVRNAWVFCKECACDAYYYAWCEERQLLLSYQKPVNPNLKPKKVEPLGLYEILLEFESDPELGDLNDRKIEHAYNIFDGEGKPHPVTIELRFPEWGLEKWDEWKLFLENDDAFADRNGASFNLNLLKFNRNKTDGTPMSEVELRNNWRNVFYTGFEIELLPGGEKITIENAALRMFGDTFTKNETTVSGLQTILGNKTTLGFIQRYRTKLLKAEQALADAKVSLHTHRNLDEDYCRVKGVDVEDVAICADVEVAPDADIERVQAQIWFEIEGYFNPPVPFYTLQELMDAGVPVEQIFNGPELNNGFIKAEELEAAALKTVLRTSDIINRLMDIEGVVAVNNLLLTKYDAEGNVIKGAADPTWNSGTPSFDANKTSASWVLFVTSLHQPRLYRNLSRFLFYKNGLPFLPRMDEAYATLTQLRGEAERPKIKSAAKDLPVPPGIFRNPEDYFPVQYSFPLTYGIGTDGLPSHVSTLRRAQARQLKAYLMVFEQLLGNAFAQLAHTADLFSLDPAVRQTYFIREFTKEIIQGYDEITNGLTQAMLEGMTETLPEFQERRNRFLDHMLARFGEQFREYALLLTNLQGRQVALDRLIEDKISFLKAYPEISHDQGKAFSYATAPCAPGNVSGLKRRLSLLLGNPDLSFVWQALYSPSVPGYVVTLHLKDQNKSIWFEGEINAAVMNALATYVNAAGLSSIPAWRIVYEAGQLLLRQENNDGNILIQDPLRSGKNAEAEVLRGEFTKALHDILVRMIDVHNYAITPQSDKFDLILKDNNGAVLGKHPELFKTEAEAKSYRDELMGWSSNERAIVVEHLLLRPKFPGDALYPVCSDGACEMCSNEDPYSFRLTFVMPGWTEPYNVNMDMRNFADRTIRQETPSHLLGKICWVGNDGFAENLCDPVIGELVELLITKGQTTGGTRPSEADACHCAKAIYATFSEVFKNWYEDKTLDYIRPDALKTLLETEFGAKTDPAGISCTTVSDAALWTEIQAVMVKYFHHIALYGWQFERFEDAWCKWLDANAVFDWTEERLQERVEAILLTNLVTDPAAGQSQQDELCKCAASILAKYGVAFYSWMDANLKAGNTFNNFTPFIPDAVMLCAGFSFRPGTTAAIEALLKDRYDAYKEVSYLLWMVVHLLSGLRSTYPGATLHDCDDGSDLNPVRLGSTALGNYPLRQTLPP